jgi:hypothetical protein
MDAASSLGGAMFAAKALMTAKERDAGWSKGCACIVAEEIYARVARRSPDRENRRYTSDATRKVALGRCLKRLRRWLPPPTLHR